MIDVDDNEYVDYDMGFGALFAGHTWHSHNGSTA